MDTPDKLTDGTKKLIGSFEALTKNVQNAGLAMGGTAVKAMIFNFSDVLPKAVEKVTKALAAQTAAIVSKLSHSIDLMRLAFQQLYVVLREGVANIKALFATAEVHRTSTTGGRGRAVSIAAGTGLMKAPAGGGQQQSELLAKLTTIDRSIISSTNITAGLAAVVRAVTETSGTINTALGQIYERQNIVQLNITNAIRRVEQAVDFTNGLLRDGIDIVGDLQERGNEQIAALLDLNNNVQASNRWLERIASPNSLHVHVKDDPASRAGLTKGAAGGKGGAAGGGGFLGGIVSTIGRLFGFGGKKKGKGGAAGEGGEGAEGKKGEEGEKGGGFFEGLLGGLKSLMTAIGGFVGVMAATTAALNPGAVEQLWLAFKDLTATIGVAFEPATRVVTTALRQMANAVLPLMLTLRPMITLVVEAFSRYLVATIRMVASALNALLPIFTPLLELFDAFTVYMTYLSSVTLTVIDVFKSFIAAVVGSGDLKDTLHEVVMMIMKAGQQLVLAIAFIAKKIGAGGFLNDLIKNFEAVAKPKQGGAMAAGPTTMTSLDQLVKSMAVSAGKAGGFAGPSPEEEAKKREEERLRLAEETLEALKEIQKKGETDVLLPQIRDAALKIADVINAIKTFIENFKNNTGNARDIVNNAAKQTLEQTTTFLNLGMNPAQIDWLRRNLGF